MKDYEADVYVDAGEWSIDMSARQLLRYARAFDIDVGDTRDHDGLVELINSAVPSESEKPE